MLYMFIRVYWRLQNTVCVANVWVVVEAAEDLNSLSMSRQQKSQTGWLGTMRGYSYWTVPHLPPLSLSSIWVEEVFLGLNR